MEERGDVETEGWRDLADVLSFHLLQYRRLACVVETAVGGCERIFTRKKGTDSTRMRASLSFSFALRMIVKRPIWSETIRPTRCVVYSTCNAQQTSRKYYIELGVEL